MTKWGKNQIYRPHFDSWNAHNLWPWILLWHNEPLHYSSNWNLANDPKIMAYDLIIPKMVLHERLGFPCSPDS
jgi:hypothetical protein